MEHDDTDTWARAAIARLLRQVGLTILREAIVATAIGERLLGRRG